LVHPDTLVADQPIDIAGYRPDNADGQFAGDISIRQSLLLSKNTVPVMLLDNIGVGAFLSRFRTIGSPLQLAASDSEAGLAVALGGVGATLEQLVWFYSAFANEGELKQLRYLQDDPGGTLGDLFGPSAANAVADILADVPPPVGAIRLVARDGTRRIGFKTGTSYGFRDAWTIGFDLLHTVGVWIGRPDGAPLLGAYGVTVAAPLAMRVFNDLPVPASGAGSGRKPLGALASPRALPPRLRRFGPARAAQQSEPVRILFPKQDAQIIGQRGADGKASLPLRVAGGRPPYRWTVLGKDAPPDPESEHELTIADRGQIEVSVRDADGKLDRISFWLD
jgi:penicillin-binding protein 1C